MVISSYSGHWPATPIRVFLVWARRGRKSAENSPGILVYLG